MADRFRQALPRGEVLGAEDGDPLLGDKQFAVTILQDADAGGFARGGDFGGATAGASARAAP
ncbi:hypothetical protein, partial [Neorhizobium sp. BETTINA12A]|uniref:hypothetical protein n=1 Tax=Neorhizobium sp. BETTINA12A TaxID=2908924 RepID=UPI001FF2BA45